MTAEHNEDELVGGLTVTLQTKRAISVRFDRDVLDFFKAQGPGYQTKMNAILRAYVRAKKDSA